MDGSEPIVQTSDGVIGILDNELLSKRRLIGASMILLLILAVAGVAGLNVVVGTGDSMEPQFQTCDLIFLDTTRNTAEQVTIDEAIAYKANSRLLVHEVVGVSFADDYVLTSGIGSQGQEQVTSSQIVGVVVGHLDTSVLCSLSLQTE